MLISLAVRAMLGAGDFFHCAGENIGDNSPDSNFIGGGIISNADVIRWY